MYNYAKDNNIIIASYGGLVPLTKAAAKDGPLKDILPKIRERVEKTYGKQVTEGQILFKWLEQKGILIVT